ncbi:hypothetical protein LJR098_002523 [Rhizobium sp. LjRoot98]|uniref:hypothetical protein n=1 Tax=unclassified Rhizobium TaxID=2613769 RepID=UPI000AF34ED7|nr:hypothetical protein [Rhizobium sp. Root1204]
MLWLKAEADGFTVAQLKEACGGDIERYLLDQQNAMTDVAARQAFEENSAFHHLATADEEAFAIACINIARRAAIERATRTRVLWQKP